jgi:two-component system heavy metal sensor histidine kinase CusS
MDVLLRKGSFLAMSGSTLHADVSMSSSPTTPHPAALQDAAPPAAASRGHLARALAVTAAIRLAAGTTLLVIAAAWTLGKRIDLGFILVPMLAYVAVAAAGFIGRRRPLAQQVSQVMPFLDIALAFVVHRHGLGTFQPFATSWAVSSLGIFTLIVALVGLSQPVRLLVVVTVLSVAAQWLLLRSPNITLYALLAASCTITFVAIATSAVPRIAAAALHQEHQAAITLDSLAKAQEQNRAFENLQRDKDALLEIIVHDMRSPVGAAMLSLEYLSLELKRQTEQAPLLEATEDALTTLNSLSAMIAQILDTSKLEGGRITLRLDRTDPKPLFEATSREVAPRAASRTVAVDVQVEAALSLALDLRLFPRALEALMTHVLRRTPEGGRMRLHATQVGSDVVVSLHSNAPAVPVNERDRIFDKYPFSEGDSRRVSGWGLGLYFCKLVVSAHQGTIAVEEVAGWTTTFVIRLPALSKRG